RDASKKNQAGGAHQCAEREHDRELPRMRFAVQESGGDEEGGKAAETGHRSVAHQIFAAQIRRGQRREPRQPRTTGDAARQGETKQQYEDERELIEGVEETARQRHERKSENEQDPRAPAGKEKSFVPDARDMTGGGNL